jgi:YHS domain-containing protein
MPRPAAQAPRVKGSLGFKGFRRTIELRAAGPVVDPVPCSACGKLIDPLRAGHVAIFDQKVHYFCNREVCRAAFLGEPVAATPPAGAEPLLGDDAAGAPIEDAYAPR